MFSSQFLRLRGERTIRSRIGLQQPRRLHLLARHARSLQALIHHFPERHVRIRGHPRHLPALRAVHQHQVRIQIVLLRRDLLEHLELHCRVRHPHRDQHDLAVRRGIPVGVPSGTIFRAIAWPAFRCFAGGVFTPPG